MSLETTTDSRPESVTKERNWKPFLFSVSYYLSILTVSVTSLECIEESKCAIGPENILFAGLSVRASCSLFSPEILQVGSAAVTEGVS